MKFRCYNETCSEDIYGRLGYDFSAKQPICPKCKTDATKHGLGTAIVKLEVLHFIHKSSEGKIITPKARLMIACLPDSVLQEHRCTGDPTVVNCDKCVATEAYLKAMEDAGEIVPAHMVDSEIPESPTINADVENKMYVAGK